MHIRQNAWKRIISFLIVKQSVILKFYYLKKGKNKLNYYSNKETLLFIFVCAIHSSHFKRKEKCMHFYACKGLRSSLVQ